MAYDIGETPVGVGPWAGRR